MSVRSRFARHFFVCVNPRAEGGRGSCAERGAQEICARLAEGLAHSPAAWESVSVTPTGCLGPCTAGPTMVVYPEGVWYAGVRAEDIDEIVREHLTGGRPVERLRFHWPSPD